VFRPAFSDLAARPAALTTVAPDVRQGLDGKQLRTETKTIDALSEPVRSQVVHAFRLAVNDSFRLATAFSLVALLIACFMRTRPLRSSVRTDGQSHEPGVGAEGIVADVF
jgi:hypothetical protein